MERLGPYRVIGVLGRGASAVVYEAVEEPLGRTVALKVLETAAGEEACARFRREAEVAARLAHPGVVPVYAAGEDQGRPWFAMERVRGQSLEALARRERVGPARAALLVAQVARALAHAHERGVLHRDVKPTNVLVDAEDRARLTDFGAARDLARASLGGGAAPGTPAYGAPEALLGGAATAAADVYGAGALLYRLLTGRDPYEGDVPSVLRRVAAGELVPPRRLLPRIPRDLETVTLRAMAHEAHRRYPSAAALALDLERHAAGEPVLGRPPGPVERARALARRRPRAVAATAALAAVALLPAALLVHRRAAVGAALTRAEGHLGRGEAGLALAAIREAQSLAPRDARSRALLREARVLDLLDRAADASGQGRTEEAVALLEAAVPMAQDLGPRVRDALSTARGDAPLALGGPPGSRVRLRPAGEPRLPPSHALPCTVPLAPGAWELEVEDASGHPLRQVTLVIEPARPLDYHFGTCRVEGGGATLREALATARPGARLEVAAGLYLGPFLARAADVEVVGVEGAGGVHLAAPGAPVVMAVRARGVRLRGLSLDLDRNTGVAVEGAEDVAVEGCRFAGVTGSGTAVRADRADGLALVGCEVEGVGMCVDLRDCRGARVEGLRSRDTNYGVHAARSPGLEVERAEMEGRGEGSGVLLQSCPGARVLGNRIGRFEYGVNAQDSSEVLVQDNVVESSVDGGIHVEGAAVLVERPRVLHNTVVGGEVGIQFRQRVWGAELRDNVVVGVRVGIGFELGSRSSDHHCVQARYFGKWRDVKCHTLGMWREAAGLDTRSLEADPLFVDASAGDYRLSPESPCRGAASDGGDLGARLPPPGSAGP